MTKRNKSLKIVYMFAIIETGGKQYWVSPQDKLRIEKLPGDPGSEVGFDKVLLVASGVDVKIGKPYVPGAKVVGKVLGQGRAKKIRILKYHSKTRYRRHIGHRQEYTEVEIQTIS